MYTGMNILTKINGPFRKLISHAIPWHHLEDRKTVSFMDTEDSL